MTSALTPCMFITEHTLFHSIAFLSLIQATCSLYIISTYSNKANRYANYEQYVMYMVVCLL